MLRTALSLSAVTGKSFEIENIRGNRSNPGLKNQHLECVKVAERLCRAETEGAELNSEKLVFKPDDLQAQSFTSNIGTAGSITLLYDTVLPICTQFNGSFRLTGKGGTDVKWSPSFSYLREVKLPLLRNFGLETDLELEKTGYYPAGNGEAELRTQESSMEPIDITGRGELERFEVFSKCSKELKRQEVADRQADEVERMLKNSHISVPVEKNVSYEKTKSTGSSLCLKAVYEESVAGFDGLGEQGKRSEDVARDVVQQFKSFHSTEAAVDQHMADQLMVFMAIVGGEIKIPEVSSHVETNLEVIRSFGFSMNISEGRGITLYS